MRALAQRVAASDVARRTEREHVNDRNLECKSGIVHKHRKLIPLPQEVFSASSQTREAAAKLRRSGRFSERLVADTKSL